MARKSPSFGQLLAYFTIPEQPGTVIVRNFPDRTDDLDVIHREFLDNSRYLPPRKNGNVLYHEVLSFSYQDQNSITPSILEDLTRKYLDLRAPYALAYAKAHFDTDCPHMHIMISANNVGSNRRIRLSRQEFAQVKRSLETYQKQKYPFLEHSVVFDQVSGKRVKKGRPESERERRKRHEGVHTPSRKEEIRETIAHTLTVTNSGEEFFHQLKSAGFRLYRRGRSVAVEDLNNGRRYRLKTLGLQESFDAAFQQWKVVSRRMESISQAKSSRSREREC